MAREVRGDGETFNPTYTPLGIAGGKFDRLSGAELARWALRAGVPSVSGEMGRQQLADAIEMHLAAIHKRAGDQAVANLFADVPA